MKPEDVTYQGPRRRPAIRLFNRVGALARKVGLARQLSEETIWRDAQRASKLQKEDDGCEDALPLLISSLNRQADLNPFGHLLMRVILANLAKNRLEVRDYLEKHPEAAQPEIQRPVFVVGLPRTGTTLIAKLLALHPEARPLMLEETFWPSPQLRGIFRKRDRRQRDVRIVERLVKGFVQNLDTVHPISADEPEECTWLMAGTFTCSVFTLLARVPDYMNWLAGLDAARWGRAYAEYKRQLQALQHQKAGGHWVLKSPVHMYSLPALLSAFPNARVVHTHRDPLQVVPSCCSLFAIVRSTFSDAVDPQVLGQEVLAILCEMVRRSCECGSDPRILHLDYHDLVRDKVGAGRRVHDHLGLAPSALAESRVLEWEGRERFQSKHRYDLAQFGLRSDEVVSLLGEG